MKKSGFLAGMVCGALLFGGTTAVAAGGILATLSQQPIFVDGKAAPMTAYAIAGNNYVKLRDVGRAVDFGVTYDGASNSVRIDPNAPYTEETPTTTPTPSVGAREDFSKQATPAIFTTNLTREVYNAMRQTVVDQDALLAGGGTGVAFTATTEKTKYEVQSVAAALGRYPVYSINIQSKNHFSCDVKYPPAYVPAAEHTQKFIDGISTFAAAEQVQEIAWYVCDRLTYESTALASPGSVLTADEVTAGNCMSYAYSFQFLCNRAKIPCILIHSENHQWNRAYVDGQWWDVDVSSNDAGDDDGHREYSKILCDQSDMQGYDYQDEEPAVTAFVMELLVPGSTQ
ncbi:MAG: transglutaminase domain-containing protein [Oscillospiraceae bacterium]